MTKRAPLVHIVDDDPAIRDALSWLFSTRQVNTELWESGEAFLNALSPETQGCILLDIRMDGLSGLEVFEQLRERQSRLPVIFLTGHGDLPLAVTALKQGAADFIEKPFNDNDLVDRVLDVLRSYEASQEERDNEQALEERLDTLSQREREVLALALEGRLNKQIAQDLSITMRTVEVHRARALEKMQARTLIELARLLDPARLREDRNPPGP
ncbi:MULTISPECIES: response regulator transcription factor [Alcaligenes]|uniref:response regulator transcription factor n=1 Tax=Alcaligenes TaxID=507 RepID=UPI0002AA86F1|nr:MULTISPECIES: response regulator [Alcaligenes]EKU28155.1 two-component response regulator [Alcaligenes sp. HPC1271]ERT55386.1 LuxR family transcriptional regulator [Alcaligenes sp. EGD-AK7]HRO19916.1 response regulator [Alcaligenes phenolicus]HRP16323.1 response regulator [Alcaligenes phenolicus]